MNTALLILGAGAVLALSGGKRRGVAGKRRKPTQEVGPDATLLNPFVSMEAIGLSEYEWPEMTYEIPFSAGIAQPIWPVVTNHRKKYVISYRTVEGEYVGNAARRFMSYRGDSRYHVGVDLYGSHGDPILATEDGIVTNIYHFYHGTYCMFVQCDSGLVINYGEIEKNSWEEFGISEGSRVQRGHAIAKVGLMSGGSQMLHFETYMPPTEKHKKYYGGITGPILNPTYYVLLARFLESSGRAFANVDCMARASLSYPVTEGLEAIAAEEKRVDEAPGDSVLAELNVDEFRGRGEDEADGP